MTNKQLIDKYNQPGPRYTSYPTVPFWKHEGLSALDWFKTVEKNIAEQGNTDISIYVHLPFCESLCTFCGCHKRITKNHAVENPYLEALQNEWSLYKALFSQRPNIKELHFGGGTPTFFPAQKLVNLLQFLFEADQVDPSEHHLSFEAHPNNTTTEHLSALFHFGFRRLSLGIQDYSPIVQKAIHRFQTFESVEKVHHEAKRLGYTSISHDLVFGLPKQTLADINDTVDKTLQLSPDRISLYSYAHVPWLNGNGQRGFDESDLPDGALKRELYEAAKNKLEANGYLEIGMDHFALKTDEMAIAFQEKRLHRNFMGYTTKFTSLLIGLGASAISDSWFGFAQNDKSVESYQYRVKSGQLPIVKGHLLSAEDLLIRAYIHDLMCHFETQLKDDAQWKKLHTQILAELTEMIHDELVEVNGLSIRVTQKGIPFVRNCCMIFDQKLSKNTSTQQLFSKTI